MSGHAAIWTRSVPDPLPDQPADTSRCNSISVRLELVLANILPSAAMVVSPNAVLKIKYF
uniref:Uncharacterized protein n=1 Tax=Romanomermis culicivorax TaxID=13658 RepID=A0A915I0M0_ROMCU